MANQTEPYADLPPAIDLEYLSANTMADEELQRDVLKLFFEQSVSFLENLADLDNDRLWYQTSHALKGSSRSVGLVHLGLLAEQAELMVGPTNGLKRRAHYHEIVEEVARARKVVRAIFKMDI